MKHKNMKQTQSHPDDGGGALIIGVAMALLVICIIGFLWKISTPETGTTTVTYEGIPGCMLSDEATHFPETIVVEDKTWIAMPNKQHQRIGFLVRDGKAEWMTRPMLVCDGKETLLWYWREKK